MQEDANTFFDLEILWKLLFLIWFGFCTFETIRFPKGFDNYPN